MRVNSDDAGTSKVWPDRRVTFRLSAPDAEQVVLGAVAGENGELPLTRNEEGGWEVTLGPLDAGVYEYAFKVDGVRTLDPQNADIKASFGCPWSLAEVPGDEPLPFETQDVPHGVLHQHWYRSASLGGFRSVFVYTPPDYDSSADTSYPVMYLLHGKGDTEGTWANVGRANRIADNLISQGEAVPMVIVMPLGHAIYEGDEDKPWEERRPGAFEDDLMNNVMPLVERSYRVKTDPEATAIVGLSMGGAQSREIGLKHFERFKWIGIFSAGWPGDLDVRFAPLLEAQRQGKEPLKLVWVGHGRDDFVREGSIEFIEWLKTNGLPAICRETDGGHNWHLWREHYLPEFVVTIFK